MAKSLDIFNVQGYDFHGAGSDNSWEPNRTGHQGNLYADGDDPYPFHFSVENAVNAYTSVGVPPRKITIGLAFYGRGWQGVQAGGKNGEWQPATGAAPGQFAEEAVATSCSTGNGGQWWTFDDVWAIQKKTAWLKQRGLLGAMIWEMSGDTATGTLINAVDAGLK